MSKQIAKPRPNRWGVHRNPTKEFKLHVETGVKWFSLSEQIYRGDK